ncbi:MAG: hypothetical protein NTX50_03795 [Candidatus Sumerlaeota bacterium]|nr:hypothetical protein [Candidatus Sumerlaeota bacterium]
MKSCILMFQEKIYFEFFVSLCLINLFLFTFSSHAADERTLVTKMYQIAPEEGPRIKAILDAELSAPRDKQTSATISSANRKIILSGASLIIQDTAENVRRADHIMSPEGRNEFMAKGKIEIGVWKLNIGSLDPKSDEARSYFNFVVEALETMLYTSEGKEEATSQGRRMWTDSEQTNITITDTPANISRAATEINKNQQSYTGGGTRKIHTRNKLPSEIANDLATIRAASYPKGTR